MVDLTILENELADAKASAEAAKVAVLSRMDTLSAQVADLKAQIDALVAGQVTQAQIDGLTVTASEFDDVVDSIVVAVTPVEEPPIV